REELPEEDAPGPAVVQQMVLGVEQPVLLRPDPEEAPASERQSIEVERLTDRPVDLRPRRRWRRVLDRQRTGPILVNPLQRAALEVGERRPQDLMALDELVERPLERDDVRPAVELEDRLEPVRVVARMQALEKPDARLRRRQRQPLASLHGRLAAKGPGVLA